VFADVVPVCLELSTERLFVETQIGLHSNTGVRGLFVCWGVKWGGGRVWWWVKSTAGAVWLD